MEAFLPDPILEVIEWIRDNGHMLDDEELWEEVEQIDVYPTPPPSSQ